MWLQRSRVRIPSLTPRNGPLAQLAEQLTLNQRVLGSNPRRPTSKNSKLDENSFEWKISYSPNTHHIDVIRIDATWLPLTFVDEIHSLSVASGFGGVEAKNGKMPTTMCGTSWSLASRRAASTAGREQHFCTPMTANMFDTLSAAQHLEAAGFGRAQAEAIAKAVRDGRGELATMADVRILQGVVDIQSAITLATFGIVAAKLL